MHKDSSNYFGGNSLHWIIKTIDLEYVRIIRNIFFQNVDIHIDKAQSNAIAFSFSFCRNLWQWNSC